MATGIELILATICLNATCMPNNLSLSTNENTNLIINDNSLNATYVIDPNTPFNKSLEEKQKYLQEIRESLNGKHLMIATLQDFPLSYTRLVNGVERGFGVSFTLIDFLAEKFNFTYSIFIPPKNIIGSKNELTDSLMELMVNQQVDLAAAFIPILGNTRDFMYYSTTILDEGEWVMIMTRPAESATGSGLLAPFDFQVWILIIVSLLCVGPIIYCLTMIRNKLTKDKSQEIYSLGHCAWFVYGALMKQGSTLSPTADSTRLIFATWWIFITILTSFYTANLTAFLTLSKFTLPFNTAKDIKDYQKHFVTIRGSGIEYSIRDPEESLADLNFMIYKNRVIFTENVNDTKTLLDLVEKKKYVFVRDHPAIDRLIYKDYHYRRKITKPDEKIHCPFAISKKPFLTKKRTFVYPKRSNLSILFDNELLNLVESGIVKFLINEKLPSAEICPQNLGGTERQLRIRDLAMTYYIVIGGFATGTVIFFTEIIFKFINRKCAKKHPIGHTLRGPVQNIQNTLPFTVNLTPPPPYTSIFNNSRKLGRISNLNKRKQITMQEIQQQQQQQQQNSEKGVRKYINGRDYIIYKGSDGASTLVPVRAPSAALFQYTYTE